MGLKIFRNKNVCLLSSNGISSPHFYCLFNVLLLTLYVQSLPSLSPSRLANFCPDLSQLLPFLILPLPTLFQKETIPLNPTELSLHCQYILL